MGVMSELNRHGGKDNGSLIVPYSTLERWVGTSNRNSIALAIRQAVELGLIAVIPGHVRKDGKKAPNRFRITWLPAHDGTRLRTSGKPSSAMNTPRRS
jgi:hypothetical protein